MPDEWPGCCSHQTPLRVGKKSWVGNRHRFPLANDQTLFLASGAKSIYRTSYHCRPTTTSDRGKPSTGLSINRLHFQLLQQCVKIAAHFDAWEGDPAVVFVEGHNHFHRTGAITLSINRAPLKKKAIKA